MRAPRTAAVAAAPVVAAAAIAAGDPAATVPSVPDTTPLPSDQIAAAPEPVVPLSAIDPAIVGTAAAEPVIPAVAAEAPKVTETAPLPSPTVVPAEPVASVESKTAFEHVDGTVPLPSDQITPVARVVVDRDGTDRFFRDVYQGKAGSGEQLAGAVDRAGQLLAVIGAARDRDVFDMLRRDLEAAGFGVVILAADTVDLLRSELDMPALSDRSTVANLDRTGVNDEDRRWFRVEFDVEHNRQAIPPGGRIFLPRADFERLRKATAVAASTEWWDGESA